MSLLFSIQIDALTPILVGGERSAGNHLWSLDYIPGNQIRGALAMKLHRQGMSPDDLTVLFGRGGITVHNTYPVSSHGCTPCFPMPLSTRESKYSPQARFVDTLLIPRTWDQPLKHPLDQAPLERPRQVFGPILSAIPLDPPGRSSSTFRPPRGLSTHIEIDRTTGTHRPGVLFTLETLGEGSHYDGLLTCTEQQAALLANGLNLQLHRVYNIDGEDVGARYSGSIELSVGQARSRGFGRIAVKLNQIERLTIPPLPERLQRFNDDVLCLPGHRYVSLTLVSDAIVVDERLRFRPALDVQDLEREYPALKGWIVRLEKAAVVPRVISGWHGGAGLPRPDDVGIAMGSAFLYLCKDDANHPPSIEALEQLEADGIGCRRVEGFGRVVVCAPRHIEGYQELRLPVSDGKRGGDDAV